MGADIATVLNFEGHALTFLETDSGEPTIQANDLAPAMEVTRRAVQLKVQELAPEDRCEVKLRTSGGLQDATFLTRSGALQVLATGRSEKCRRLRKVICDFFVEWMDGKHRQAPDVRPLLEEVSRLGRAVVALTAEVAELKRPVLRPLQHGLKRYGLEDLHILTPGEEARLWRGGFSTSAAFLQDETGQKAPGPKAGGLTNRAVRWSKRNGSEVRRYLKSGQVVTFLPRTVLAELYAGQVSSGQLLLTAHEPRKGG